MATQEGVVLNGLDLNDGTNYTVESFTVPPAKKRPEWITGGDSNGARLAREALYENRTVTCRVRVEQKATMDLALAAVGALTDKLQEAEKGGVDLVWTPADSTKSGALEVLMAEVDSLPVVVQGDDAGWYVKSPVAEVTLTCRPGIRGAEVVGTPASSTDPLVTVELTGVTGDLPADGRLIVTDNATQSRRHVEWGLESLHYPTSSPPSLLIDSDGLVTTGFAGTGTTRSGAYDPGAAGNSVIQATLATQPVAVCGTGNLSHVGTFRVKARVYAVATLPEQVWVRLAWSEGDGPYRANPYVTPPVINGWAEVDLGLIIVPAKVLGTQRWTGRIEASTTAVGTTIDIDVLELIPAGEGYGVARGEYAYKPGVLVARDEFTGTIAGGGLNTRVAPLGGTWATAGAATDLVFSDLGGGETVIRSTTSDAGAGRLAVLGATDYTNVEVGVDFFLNAATGAPTTRVLLRYTDANNYAYAQVQHEPAGYSSALSLLVVVAGVTTALGGVVCPDARLAWHTLRVVASASGQCYAQVIKAGAVVATVSGQSSVLATAGALATGKPGFADLHAITGAVDRLYDNFYAATPAAEPIAVYSGQSLEVRSDSAIREDSTGTYWGPAPSYRGSRFTVPPAGAGARKVRVAVKARRNDVAVAADDNIADSLTVQANYSPRWLTVPR